MTLTADGPDTSTLRELREPADRDVRPRTGEVIATVPDKGAAEVAAAVAGARDAFEAWGRLEFA